MKFSDFIVKDALIPTLAATDREAVLRELVESLAKARAIEPDAVEDVIAALVKREKSGSTGFGSGVAVPHVKHPKIKKMVGALGRSPAGLNFASLDHLPCYVVLLLLSPENEPQQHLAAMTVTFNSLKEDTFRRFLRQCTTREQIAGVLDDADEGLR